MQSNRPKNRLHYGLQELDRGLHSRLYHLDFNANVGLARRCVRREVRPVSVSFPFLPFSCFLAIIFLLYLPSQSAAQGELISTLLANDSAEQAERRATTGGLDILSLGLEIVPSPGSGSFFDEYRKLFGSTQALTPSFSPTLTARIGMGEKLRFVLSTAYIGTGFNELYNAYGVPNGSGNADTLVPVAEVLDDMALRAVPALVGVQYTPIRAQFTSYVGVVAGGAFVSSSWTTVTNRFLNSNYSRPQTNVEDLSFFPAFRFFTGVDLQFDGAMANKNLLRGVYIEAAYFYLPVTLEYFKEIRTLGRALPVLPEEDNGTLNLGGLTLTLGVNMQLLRL